ncbi:MAG TPA: DoxX family protein [Chloroflexota bacterium]|nr:DoxX family protein [Chloroflexota bacterium]
MRSLALLILRLTVGSLIAGHGAQKLFGSFQGPGIEQASGMMESLGYRPGRPWAMAASWSELGGGILTALGLLNPLGPLCAMCVMVTATFKAHAGKPVWVTHGGAELPLTNMAAASAITLAGPGNISMDRLLGIKLPWWFNVLAFGTAAAVTYAGIESSNRAQQAQPQSPPSRIAAPSGGEAHLQTEAVRPEQPHVVTEGS